VSQTPSGGLGKSPPLGDGNPLKPTSPASSNVDKLSSELKVLKANMGWLWHHRLAHIDMRNLHKVQKYDHILGLTNIIFEKDRPCGACQAGRQVGAHHHAKNIMTTIRPLEMLHINLFGPIIYISIGDNKYILIIVDDYSHFSWVFFLQDKSET
jgi:hypothetical protein